MRFINRRWLSCFDSTVTKGYHDVHGSSNLGTTTTVKRLSTHSNDSSLTATFAALPRSRHSIHADHCACCRTFYQLLLRRAASSSSLASLSSSTTRILPFDTMDPNSFANTDEIQTRHLHLDLNVDFSRKILAGTSRLSLQAVKEGVSTVTLDTNALNIKNVSLLDHAEPLKFELGDKDHRYGTPLRIQLPKEYKVDDKLDLVVEYETTREASALQWLTPMQTVGKQHPYLFTQCKHMAPVQDSPGIKLTYSANIHTPKPLRALMSALNVGQEVSSDGQSVTYRFEQRTSMPSYLVALAVGNIEGREIGPRSTVWSEPEVVEKAAWEFVDTERFIATGESLLTPYEWGRYDLLVLPSSFPYGGMENPCLTFVTPTLLAGDRSLVDVVAHEIAHSWMGNLVTTKNWEHFWLNEGWTMFIERKIIGRLHSEADRQFSSILGLKDLKTDIDEYGPDHPFTALCPDLEGADPDDAFSTVPYEKGYNLLYYLEQLLGGPSVFEPYMKAYVERFAGQSIDTNDWKLFLYEYMRKHHGDEKVKVLDQVDWHAWIKGTGMPPVTNEFDTSLAEACISLANRWDAARNSDKLDFSPNDIKDFSSSQKVAFFDKLSEYPSLPADKLAAMDKIYGLTEVTNCEVRFAWQMLCLSAAYSPIYPHVVTFLEEQGRMKYVRPLYRGLNKVDSQLAKDTFLKNRDEYHPIASRMIAKDLGISN
ncbi:peptidase family M1-domain-containing protein [Syncephalis fuscata]|nr:peptidase family M1-domain-containing protein [Syncephalis fuscata]